MALSEISIARPQGSRRERPRAASGQFVADDAAARSSAFGNRRRLARANRRLRQYTHSVQKLLEQVYGEEHAHRTRSAIESLCVAATASPLSSSTTVQMRALLLLSMHLEHEVGLHFDRRVHRRRRRAASLAQTLVHEVLPLTVPTLIRDMCQSPARFVDETLTLLFAFAAEWRGAMRRSSPGSDRFQCA